MTNVRTCETVRTLAHRDRGRPLLFRQQFCVYGTKVSMLGVFKKTHSLKFLPILLFL